MEQAIRLNIPMQTILSKDEITSEEKVILAAQQDLKNFEPLYRKYHGRIVNFIYNRVSGKDLAFEIASNVFLKAMEKIKKYQSKGLPFSAWLYRIAINEINQHYRKSNTRRVIVIEDEGIKQLKAEVVEINTEEEDDTLYKALNSLSEEEMDFIQLKYFDGLTFGAICEIFNIKESACKMKVYRILEKLQTKLRHL